MKLHKSSIILFSILILLAGMACGLLPSGNRTNPPNNVNPPNNNVNPPNNNVNPPNNNVNPPNNNVNPPNNNVNPPNNNVNPPNNNVNPPNNNFNPPDNNGQNPNNAGRFQLEGTWESQSNTQYGVVYYELILEYTRTFSQQVILNDLLTYDVGTYAVGDGFIRFIVENHEPKTYNGQDMHWLTSFTYFYTILDAGSMSLEDRIAGTRWTVYRR